MKKLFFLLAVGGFVTAAHSQSTLPKPAVRPHHLPRPPKPGEQPKDWPAPGDKNFPGPPAPPPAPPTPGEVFRSVFKKKKNKEQPVETTERKK